MSIDDPLRVLRTDDPPVQPDPAFAAALRVRCPDHAMVIEGLIPFPNGY